MRLAGGWNAEQHRIAQKLIDDGGFDVTLLGPLSQTQLAEEFNRETCLCCHRIMRDCPW